MDATFTQHCDALKRRHGNEQLGKDAEPRKGPDAVIDAHRTIRHLSVLGSPGKITAASCQNAVLTAAGWVYLAISLEIGLMFSFARVTPTALLCAIGVLSAGTGAALLLLTRPGRRTTLTGARRSRIMTRNEQSHGQS